MLLATTAFAGPWAVVATNPPGYITPTPRGSIFTVDLGTNPPTRYGPFLQGSLGSPGAGVFDVVVLPNQREALVSTFGDNKIHKINLTDPRHPKRVRSRDITFFAEDIAVTPDGRTAVVTDGGFSTKVAFLDTATLALLKAWNLPKIRPPLPATPISRYANAVAVGPDGMVFLVDYFQGYVHYGRIAATRKALTGVKSLFLCTSVDADGACVGDLIRPINISVSPGGDTVMVTSAAPPGVAVFKYNRLTGILSPGSPSFLPFEYPYGGFQSVVFGSNRLAYTVSAFTDISVDPPEFDFNKVSVLAVGAPGVASVKYPGIASTATKGSSQLFGVDVMAVLGTKMLVSNPTLSAAADAITLFDTRTFQGKEISFDDNPADTELGYIPTGVAIMNRP